MAVKDLIALYQNNGSAIFSRTLWHEIRDLAREVHRVADPFCLQ
jgi:hypothetical protein